MKELPFLQVAFQVNRKIDPEIIRDPVGVPVGIINHLYAVEVIDRYRIGHRAPCGIHQVG
jgi:hypothetical protein